MNFLILKLGYSFQQIRSGIRRQKHIWQPKIKWRMVLRFRLVWKILPPVPRSPRFLCPRCLQRPANVPALVPVGAPLHCEAGLEPNLEGLEDWDLQQKITWFSLGCRSLREKKGWLPLCWETQPSRGACHFFYWEEMYTCNHLDIDV